jgi:signal transduction histidine kinase
MTDNRIGRLHARLVSYFLPPSIAADRASANTARMFLSSHLIGPILSTPAVLVFAILDPTPGFDIVVLALSLYGFWLFPFLLRAGVPYNLLVFFSILNLHFVILWNCFHYGGITSPTMIWILIIPILSVFYSGGNKAMRPLLLFASFLSFGAFLSADTWVSPGPNDLSAAAEVGVGAASTIGTLAYVAAMSIYYARIFDAGVDLENEVQHRRRLAVELRRAVIAANNAASAKSEFLARMSHELRTPLNAIIGYAQLLKEEAEDTNDDVLAEDVDRILDAGEFLVRLINLILDLSKIEAGRMQLCAAPCDIGALLAEVAAERRDLVEANGNALVLELSDVPDGVLIDGGQLRRVVGAILENAAQHTENGEVVLRCRVSGKSRSMFAIVVEDSGKGIDPGVLPFIMDTSSMSGHAGGRYGGTGLSLTVALKLCQLMGGGIDVASAPGRGSRFTVTLPLAAAETSPPRSQDRPALTAAAA